MNSIFAVSNNSSGDSILMILLCTAIVMAIFAYSIVLIVQAIKGLKDNYTTSMLKLFGGLTIIIIYIYGGVVLLKSSTESYQQTNDYEN